MTRTRAFVYDAGPREAAAEVAAARARVATCEAAIAHRGWVHAATYQDEGGGPVNGRSRPYWVGMIAQILGDRRARSFRGDVVVLVADWAALAVDDTTIAVMKAQLALAGAELTALADSRSPTP